MSFLETAIREFFGLLVPPHGADEDKNYRWRVNVAIILGATTMTLAAFIGISFGIVPLFGFSGFAYAGDVRDNQQQIVSLRTEGLQAQIIAFQEKRCELVQHNPEAAKLYDRMIRERQQQYRQITKEPVELPPC